MAETAQLAVSRGDDAVQWVLGARSRREARTCAAVTSPTLRVVAAAVRPTTQGQCAAQGHPAESCLCWRTGEAWYRPCGRDEPEAISAWRIEPRAGARCWRALRALTARLVDRRERQRPVLWGGRVLRAATWLDRALGYQGFVVLGDRWLRAGMGEIRWCSVCEQHTSHSESRRGWFCAAHDHDERRAARRRAA